MAFTVHWRQCMRIIACTDDAWRYVSSYLDSHLHTNAFDTNFVSGIFLIRSSSSFSLPHLRNFLPTFVHENCKKTERESRELDKEKRGREFEGATWSNFDPYSWRSQVFDNCAQLINCKKSLIPLNLSHHRIFLYKEKINNHK